MEKHTHCSGKGEIMIRVRHERPEDISSVRIINELALDRDKMALSTLLGKT